MRNLKKVLSVLLVVAIMAISLVPAFAAESSYTYEAQAKALYNVGLFNGVSATEYAPDLGSALNREQGFKIVLSLLGKADAAKALTAADADAILATFGDAKDVEPTLKNYVAYAIKSGLSIGDDKKLINPKGAMLGKDFATMLLRNLGYADSEFKYDTAAADLAAKGGLTTTEAAKFNDKELIRDDAVGIAYAALKAAYKDGTTVIAKLVADKAIDETKAIDNGMIAKPVAGALTATITGAKKITVAFNKAVDFSKVTYTVTKGTITWNIASTTPADDKKSAVIELSGKLSDGEYTVSVAGVDADALTAKVTAEDEKVAKIAFTSDKAVMKRSVPAASTDANTVTASYKIYNQYNEDVTSAYWNSSDMSYNGSATTVDSTSSKGKISLTSSTAYEVGDKVTVSALNSETGAFNSATLTVSDKAEVAEVAISSLYNADGKTAPTMTSTSTPFELVFDVKDQYGNNLTNKDIAKEDIIVTSSDTDIIDVARTTLNTVSVPAFNTDTTIVKDSTKLVLPLGTPLKAGTVKITAISEKSGKLATFDVTVKDIVKVDTLTFDTPEIAVAGEKVNVPFTAVDQDGNAITNAADLVSGTNFTSISASSGSVAFEQDYVTGKAKLVLNATSFTAKKTVVITAVTKTNKTAQITLSVVAPATPAVVVGLTSDVKSAILKGETSSIKKSYLKVKDQYGRDYSDYTLGTADEQYRFTVASSNEDYISADNSADSGVAYNSVDKYTYCSVDGSAIKLKALKKGNSTVTIALQQWDAEANNNAGKWISVVGSEYTYNDRAVELSDIKSYTVDDITTPISNDPDVYYTFNVTDPAKNPTLNKQDSHAVSLKVNGKLDDGTTVSIPVKPQYVDISISSPLLIDSQIEDSSYRIVGVDAAQSVFGTDKTEKSATFVVSVKGNDGVVPFVKTVTVSNKTPEIASVAFRAEADMPATVKDGSTLDLNVESESVISTVYSYADTEDEIDSFVNAVIKVTDTYGKVIRDGYDSTNGLTNATYAIADGNIIVSNIKDSKDSAKDADDNAYTVDDLAAGFSYTVTAITNNGIVFTFKVVLVQDGTFD